MPLVKHVGDRAQSAPLFNCPLLWFLSSYLNMVLLPCLPVVGMMCGRSLGGIIFFIFYPPQAIGEMKSDQCWEQCSYGRSSLSLSCGVPFFDCCIHHRVVVLYIMVIGKWMSSTGLMCIPCHMFQSFIKIKIGLLSARWTLAVCRIASQIWKWLLLAAPKRRRLFICSSIKNFACRFRWMQKTL